MTIALIDLEPFVYRAAWAAQKTVYQIHIDGNLTASFTTAKAKKKWLKELGLQVGDYEIVQVYDTKSVEMACYNASDIINNIMEDITPDSMEMYLPDKEHAEKNFRLTLYPEYKANRRDLPKPVHYDAVIDYYADNYDISYVAGIEVDDALSIRMNQLHDDGIIVTIDKDLDTVSGWHYNPVNRNRYHVDHHAAEHFFYEQVLTGDVSDNIIGLYKVGPATAAKLLAGCSTSVDMWNKVLKEYKNQNRTEEDALLNARLLHMLRTEDEIWQPPSA